MGKILFIILFIASAVTAQSLNNTVSTDSTVYKLETIKIIDGVEDCTHFKVAYVLDSLKVVGDYGVMDSVFTPKYTSAVGLKSDLINYKKKVQNAR